MSIHRWNPRRDDNERAIIAVLEAAAGEENVRQASSRELPDLIVGFRGVTYMLGVKRPPGPRGGKSRWRKYDVKGGRDTSDVCPPEWNGGPWKIVTSPEEALAAIGLTCRRGRVG